MTDRIPLDHLTSDQYDALYEQLEAAEDTETQRQLATAREAFASATTRAARAEAALAEVLNCLYPITRADDPTPLGYQAVHPVHPNDYNRWRAALEQPAPAAATGATGDRRQS